MVSHALPETLLEKQKVPEVLGTVNSDQTLKSH